MKTIAFILLLIPLNLFSDYPLKFGIPTSKGIEKYVNEKKDSLIVEYENFIKDTLFDIWIYTDDLTDYVDFDSLELGRYYPEEIIISTAELFIAYELADLSKFRKTWISESNKFVKSTIFHELTHDYFNQIIKEMRYIDSVHVSLEYVNFRFIIIAHTIFSADFIEEGICEYMVENMEEIIPPKKPFIPKTKEDLVDINNSYKVNYKYSSYYLKEFLDTTGFKKGVKILLYNSPPSYEEILKPNLFFNRLITY